MIASPEHIEISRIQKEIEEYLALEGTGIVFDFQEQTNRIRLDVITVNPRHNQSFLFHTTSGTDKVEALQKMLDYVKNYKERESSYTIQWTAKKDKELHTSYFRAKDIPEAINKLHYGKDPNTITIFSVVLNPIT